MKLQTLLTCCSIRGNPNPFTTGPISEWEKECVGGNGVGDDRHGSTGQGKNMASILELAVVYVRALQKDLADARARLEVAEKLVEGNSSSQTSD